MSINKIRIWGAHSSVFEEGGVNINKVKVLRAFSFLGASDLTLLPLHQLVVFKSALMVSETSASETGSLEERLQDLRQTLITFRPFPFAAGDQA